MPPLLVFNVPASVIAPFVAELGVNPVVPALKLVTATPETDDHAGKPEETVKTCPAEPMPNIAVVADAD